MEPAYLPVPGGQIGVTEFTGSILALQNAPRTVIGYHGCSQDTADRIFAEQRFLLSTRAYDWLGEGFYFWEYAPYRAFEWAEQKCEREGGTPAVIRTTIKLGRCLNLLDIKHLPDLLGVYNFIASSVGNAEMPINTDRGAHFLDREIIDTYCRAFAERTASPLQTVRGSLPKARRSIPDQKSFTRRIPRLLCVILLASCGHLWYNSLNARCFSIPIGTIGGGYET